MKPVTTYENKRILVLGLARSGVSAARLLHQLGAFVTVNDAKEFEENPEARELLALGIRVITGSHPVELLDEEFSMIVKNPGIPYSNPILEKAITIGLPIITEVELAYEVSESEIIGITGTNGKTTTTTMIGAILNSGLKEGKAWLAGNIGDPASSVAQKVSKNDVMVTELSSFQLMGIIDFHPQIAVITNLYEAHLDYHGSRKEYVAAKWQLQKNMTIADYLIVNGDQEELVALAKKTEATVLFFSTKGRVGQGAYLLEEGLWYNDELIMAASELGVPGEHNIENALASIIVAKLKGISSGTIKEVLSHFRGVEHRTEFVAEIEGRKFYNDSKATNSLATEKALSGFDTRRVVLLAGGLDRGNSFDELIPALRGLKALVVFGETKFKLQEAAKLAKVPMIHLANSVTDATEVAFKLSDVGDSVLLSPACASWDQYKNFEERGRAFKETVLKLTN